jgi:hypothetical protein
MDVNLGPPPVLAPPPLTPPADNSFPLRTAFGFGFFVSESRDLCEFTPPPDLMCIVPFWTTFLPFELVPSFILNDADRLVLAFSGGEGEAV